MSVGVGVWTNVHAIWVCCMTGVTQVFPCVAERAWVDCCMGAIWIISSLKKKTPQNIQLERNSPTPPCCSNNNTHITAGWEVEPKQWMKVEGKELCAQWLKLILCVIKNRWVKEIAFFCGCCWQFLNHPYASATSNISKCLPSRLGNLILFDDRWLCGDFHFTLIGQAFWHFLHHLIKALETWSLLICTLSFDVMIHINI